MNQTQVKNSERLLIVLSRNTE